MTTYASSTQLDRGTCRSCGAPIRWVKMESSGKANPLNADPDPEKGNVALVQLNEAVRGRVLGPLEVIQEQTRPPHERPALYLSHFATCPNGPAHRKAGK